GIFRCLFWFNPLVWVSERLMRLDQEVSCDERVISDESAATRRLYGQTMLQAAHVHLDSTKANYPPSFSQMRRRTWFLGRHRPNDLRNGFGVLLLAGVLTASVVLGSAGVVGRDATVRPALAGELDAIRTALAGRVPDNRALGQVVSHLRSLARTSTVPPFDDYELYRINSQLGATLFRMGQFQNALDIYDRALDFGRVWPDAESATLIAKADVHYAMGEYSDALRMLVRAEAIDAGQYLPETWALRGFSLAKLGIWDQALICMELAANEAREDNRMPPEQWLLAQAALRLNQNDLDGAATALEASRQAYPDTPHAERLSMLNEFIQISWAPNPNRRILTLH
ncbi:MAG: M56 family metallopeptidase, partial [Xanthomonadales bacterium]|nr:M56 family metallopeptidase [Xanthomonadales bacterium]